MTKGVVKTGWSTGAVAVVDALGVKRLSDSHQPSEIAQRVREAAKTAKRLQDGYLTQVAGHQYPYHQYPLAMDFAALSDTVIVAASVPVETEEPDPQLLSDMVWRTALSLGYLVRHATQADPPLAYRGAIALGRLWRDDYEPPDFPVIGCRNSNMGRFWARRFWARHRSSCRQAPSVILRATSSRRTGDSTWTRGRR